MTTGVGSERAATTLNPDGRSTKIAGAPMHVLNNTTPIYTCIRSGMIRYIELGIVLCKNQEKVVCGQSKQTRGGVITPPAMC